jgi:hypothetical protein
MTDDFAPRLNILPKSQRRLWDDLDRLPTLACAAPPRERNGGPSQ